MCQRRIMLRIYETAHQRVPRRARQLPLKRRYSRTKLYKVLRPNRRDASDDELIRKRRLSATRSHICFCQRSAQLLHVDNPDRRVAGIDRWIRPHKGLQGEALTQPVDTSPELPRRHRPDASGPQRFVIKSERRICLASAFAILWLPVPFRATIFLRVSGPYVNPSEDHTTVGVEFDVSANGRRRPWSPRTTPRAAPTTSSSRGSPSSRHRSSRRAPRAPRGRSAGRPTGRWSP